MSFDDLISAMDGHLIDILGDDHEITFTPDGGDAEDVDGIFDSEYRLVDVTDRSIVTTAPVLFLQLESLSVTDDDDIAAGVFTVDGTEYSAAEIQRDGHGSARIILTAD